MTYQEESYILDSVNQIKHTVHQNSIMLEDICKVINTYLANHNKENEEDFGRNVLANLLSGSIDLSRLRRP